MIQERAILKVVPHISAGRSLRIDVRGSRTLHAGIYVKSTCGDNGIAPTLTTRLGLVESCGTDNPLNTR